MNKKTVARRYATALFNLLDTSGVEAAGAGLTAVSEVFQRSTAFRHLMASPVFAYEEKRSVLDALAAQLGAPPVMRGFLGQVVKKNRVGVLPEIAEAFSALVDAQRGIQHVWVATAKDLSSEERRDLEAQLACRLHREVKVSFQTIPQLIGGLEIRLGSRVFDNTVRGKLAAMRALLEKG